jgi:hypothetical protein
VILHELGVKNITTLLYYRKCAGTMAGQTRIEDWTDEYMCASCKAGILNPCFTSYARYQCWRGSKTEGH